MPKKYRADSPVVRRMMERPETVKSQVVDVVRPGGTTATFTKGAGDRYKTLGDMTVSQFAGERLKKKPLPSGGTTPTGVTRARVLGGEAPKRTTGLGGQQMTTTPATTTQPDMRGVPGTAEALTGAEMVGTPGTAERMLVGGEPAMPTTGTAPSDWEQYIGYQTEKAISPYLDILGESTAAQTAAAQAEIDRLEAMKEGATAPIQSALEAEKAMLESRYAQRLAEQERSAGIAKEDLAKRFAFTGFGRSSEHVQDQETLALQANNLRNEILKEQELQIRAAEMRAQGESEEALQSISDRIGAQRDKIAGLQQAFEENKANLRLQAMETGQASYAGVMEQLSAQALAEQERMRPDLDLSKAVGYMVNSMGEPVMGGSAMPANANTALSKAMGYLVDDFGSPIMDAGGQPISLPEEAPELKYISGTKHQPAGYFNPATGEFMPLNEVMSGAYGGGVVSGVGGTGGGVYGGGVMTGDAVGTTAGVTTPQIGALDNPLYEKLARDIAVGKVPIEEVNEIKGLYSAGPEIRQQIVERSQELQAGVHQALPSGPAGIVTQPKYLETGTYDYSGGATEKEDDEGGIISSLIGLL